jgi:hypothetical protein
MKKELQEKIFKKYPLLYGDRTKPMQETCMCWGLDVGNGWYDLIDEVSAKLEAEIKQFIKENPVTSCRNCSCLRIDHYGGFYPDAKQCLSVHKRKIWMPYSRGASLRNIFAKPSNKFQYAVNKYFYRLRDLPFKVYNRLIRLASKFVGLFFYKLQTCHCQKYEAIYPRASQVKEKFAGLRLYLNHGTDKMYEITHEYEAKSYKICDRCGGPGETLRVGGWLHAACKACLAKEGLEADIDDPEEFEEDEN